MDLEAISHFINDNSLAVLILLTVIYGGWKLISPYFKKKLEKSVENEGELEQKVTNNYFELVSDSMKKSEETNKKLLETNKEILEQMGKVTETNKEISKTNSILSKNIGQRVEELEKTVDKINTKMDIMIK